ncbi:MAG: HAD-IA family hydrolase [Patescibacteria group bacterium]|nr:HAD-IA family hydrolase [Patescibacteria group bacterium]
MKKPAWVIFDIGGVIFNSDSAFRDISEYLKADKKQIMENIIQYLGDDELGKTTFEDVWKNLLKPLNKQNEYKKVIEIWWELKRWIDDTKVLISELNKAGYKLAILTNNWKGMGERILNDTKDFLAVDYIFESSAEGLRKPDLRFYKLVEKRIGASGENIYFIDDSSKNIEAAKNMKWQAFLYSIGNDDGKSANDLIRKELLS